MILSPRALNQPETIIDSIHDVVQDFPQQMLFLDTSCVTDIRYQNHLAQRKTDSRSFSNSSIQLFSQFSAFGPAKSSHRRRRTAITSSHPFSLLQQGRARTQRRNSPHLMQIGRHHASRQIGSSRLTARHPLHLTVDLSAIFP